MAECQVHPSRHLIRGLAIATGLDTRPSTGPTNPPSAVIVGLVPSLVGGKGLRELAMRPCLVTKACLVTKV